MIRSDFNFEKIRDDTYLITNYSGRYAFLNGDEFTAFCKGNNLNHDTSQKLIESYFCADTSSEQFMVEYSNAIRNYRNYLFSGTSLHIFVLTTQCNLKCVYCQASTHDKGSMMSFETAEKSVDLALQSPSSYLSFEFQGGEPLENFDVIKHIVEYTERNALDKSVDFNLVSNLTLMNDEIANFIKEHNINVSTSLDGDELLQNVNRPFPGKNGYEIWKTNYRRVRELLGHSCGAIQTTTRKSLDRYKEIVDEYIDNGFNRVFLRPLTPLGYAATRWEAIGYTANEFIGFYRKAFEYILEKCKNGYNIAEGHACIFLDKIINHRAGNYTELTSPCGAALGQLAYNYDGNIYTCDEGRMMAEMGDQTFKLGTVDMKYSELFDSPVCKLVANASCLEFIPQCESCVFSPYCGTCPVLNHYENESVFPVEPNGYKCKIHRGILEILFSKLLDGTNDEKKIMRSWVQDI